MGSPYCIHLLVLRLIVKTEHSSFSDSFQETLKVTCTVFLSSYRNTNGNLGERENQWEHEPQASVSTAFSSSPKLS